LNFNVNKLKLNKTHRQSTGERAEQHKREKETNSISPEIV